MPSANLLLNSTFDSEKYDSTPFDISGLLPRHWQLTAYSKPSDPKLDKQDQNWQQPDILPVKRQPAYGATGATGATESNLMPISTDRFVLRIFKNNAPIFASFSQIVDTPAGMYRFTCSIFPDQKLMDGSRPSPASGDDWYLASEASLLIRYGDTGVTRETGWLDARAVPIGKYTALDIEFYHFGGPLIVGFSLRGRWGFQNNGWFVNECSLVRMDYDPAIPIAENRTVLELAEFALESAQQAAHDAQAVVDALSIN